MPDPLVISLLGGGDLVIGQNRSATFRNGDFFVGKRLFDGISPNFRPIQANEASFEPSQHAPSKGDLCVEW